MGKDKSFDIRSWTSYQSEDDEKECRFQTIMKSFDQKVLLQGCKEACVNSDIDIDCAI